MRPIDRYVAAWRQSLHTTLDLGRRLGPQQWHARTGCPDWSVGDVYAHLVGGELWMHAGGVAPDVPLPRFVQEPVDERRSRPAAAVLDELAAVIAEREAQLDADPLDPTRPAATAWGAPITYERQLMMRAFDVWVHEQDIRRAVGAPGGLATPGAHVAREMFLESLPRVVAKGARAPAGSSVRITVVGEVGWDVAVRVDHHGRGSFAATTADPVAAHLTLSWPEYVRRGCGRDGTPAEVWISGDAHLANHVLAALAITP
jgi:uncharacterized protein (TIGR03083 family)